MRKYSYDMIQDYICNHKEEWKHHLPELTLKRIEQLKKFISNKDYSVMPVFMKEKHKKDKFKNNKMNEHLHKKSFHCLSTSKQIKSVFHKENISDMDKQLNYFRRYLNKLTEQTYEDMELSILEIITTLDDKYLFRVASHIFEIASMNKFFSKLYARLYSTLCERHQIFKNVIEHHCERFLNKLNKIHYVSPDKDYDKYCNYTTIIHKHTSFACFLVELMNKNVLSVEFIIRLMNEIVDTIHMSIEEFECKEMIQDLIQMLNEMLMCDIHHYIRKNDDFYTYIIHILKDLNSIEHDTYEGLTLKTKFKIMDIIEFVYT